ncbi:MAG: HAMP domain-containing protein [Actinobacteria bacterium]|nr:HAMP domain-containing protein [Actinomycetota bacterium]
MSGNNKKFNRARSSILFQVTALTVVVFIMASIVSYYVYMRSTDALIEKSREKVINTQAGDMSSSFLFITDMIASQMEEKVGAMDIMTFVQAIQDKEVLPIQETANTQMKKMIDDGTLGLQICAVAIPEVPPTITEPLVIMTSEDTLMYTEVPESISKYLEGDGGHELLENGVPEWGLENEQLLVYDLQRAEALRGYGMWAILLRPMHDDIGSIEGYFNKEKKNIDILMTIVIISTILLLVAIMFLVLSFLIRKKITRPIDELEEAAEKVMEGDMDIEVPIRKGEEFERLKYAFNEMLKSIRKFMNWKSDAGGEE